MNPKAFDAKLCAAIKAGELKAVTKMINDGLDVNYHYSKGTPLDLCVTYNQPEIAEILLQNGAKVDDHGEDGFTALIKAAREDLVDLAKVLIKYNANVNHVDAKHRTALYHAISKRNQDVAKVLLDNHADPNIPKHNKMRVTPLIKTILMPSYELAEFLLDNGADVEYPDKMGMTPLCVSVLVDPKFMTIFINHDE